MKLSEMAWWEQILIVGARHACRGLYIPAVQRFLEAHDPVLGYLPHPF